MPVTHNNYTFSPAVYTVIENGNLGLEVGSATITISAVNGYTISAGDFSLDPSFSNPYVDSVSFTQSGDDVICTVIFESNATMPSSNLTIPLCIIGEANVNLVLISGTYTSVVGSDITPSSQTNVSYTGSGSPGQTVSLFSKTFTANAGFYMSVSPSAQIIEGNQSNYTISQTPGYNSENQLTSIVYEILYTFPNFDVSGDNIKFNVPKAAAIYVPSQEITAWSIPLSVIPNFGNTRLLNVSGEEGAVYSITLTDGTTTQNIAQNITMVASGLQQYNIEFAENTTNSNINWTLSINGDIASSVNTPIELVQANKINGYWEPKTSSNFQGGFSVENIGDYIAEPAPNSDMAIVEIQWIISSTSGSPLAISQDISNMPWENFENVIKEVTGASAGTATMSSTTGIVPGMRFNFDGSTGAPLDATVTSVISNGITYIPASLSLNSAVEITFTNANGFNFDPSGLTSELLTPPTSAVVNGQIIVERFGDTNTTFKLDLDNLFEIVSLNSVFLLQGKSSDEACCSLSSTEYFIDTASFTTATKIFEDSAGQILAQGPLYYSSNGVHRLWSGTEFSTGPVNCSSCSANGPYTLQYDSSSGTSSCCTTTTATVYLDTTSLSTATEIYTDASGTVTTQSGSYSDGTIYRNYDATTSTFQTAAIACPDCYTALTLCYATTQADLCCGNKQSVTVYVPAGENFTTATNFYATTALSGGSKAPNGYYSEDFNCSIQP